MVFGHAIGGEHLPLALGRPAAVAAHGGDDERLGAALPEAGDERRDDLLQALDAAAPSADRDPGAGPDAARDLRLRQLVTDRLRRRRDAPMGQVLPDAAPGRELRSLPRSLHHRCRPHGHRHRRSTSVQCR